ncbi:MAG: ThiF family adenylyltransferase [Proteobacteria bacterium]|nr:ThiF family adenylyltransferase [Pseudomonadota bacterium]
MNVSIEQAVSRPLAVAEGLLRRPIDETVVYSKVVVLTGETGVVATANGRWCFLDALALLSRVVGHLIVAVPPEAKHLRQEVDAYCERAWTRGAISIVDGAELTLLRGAHAVLNIGAEMRPELPWTSINANGWIARVSSRTKLPADTHEPNPIAALLAASLGVTEIFKRIFEVPEEIAPLLGLTQFSLYELTTSPTCLGPALPSQLRFPDTLLTGAGAIGNAIALLLAQLRIEGRLHIIDRQRYRDENMGTCLLMERNGWLKEPKALRLAAWLKQHSILNVTSDEITIEAAIADNRLDGLTIDLALNGLDDPGARRETQRLWPSVIIDGGINEVGAAVTEYRLDWQECGCLMCWFDAPQLDEKALQSRWTGLRRDSLDDANRQLSDRDIVTADESKREWLRARQREGKTVCSVVTEAQLAARLGVAANEGFRPSVPFVAAASASLVVGAAVRAFVFPQEPAPSMFQIGSLFLGPAHSATAKRSPSERCQCVLQRKLIMAVHARRMRNCDRKSDAI